jgi:hypothetical protein
MTPRARALLHDAVARGRAAEVARRMVAAQGGDPRAVDDPAVFAKAPLRAPLAARARGSMTAIDTHAVGIAGVVARGRPRRAPKTPSTPRWASSSNATSATRCARASRSSGSTPPTTRAPPTPSRASGLRSPWVTPRPRTHRCCLVASAERGQCRTSRMRQRAPTRSSVSTLKRRVSAPTRYSSINPSAHCASRRAKRPHGR